jgi:predicted  nucleic acid-binding Zn-ribbon protein
MKKKASTAKTVKEHIKSIEYLIRETQDRLLKIKTDYNIGLLVQSEIDDFYIDIYKINIDIVQIKNQIHHIDELIGYKDDLNDDKLY